ncbi:MAG: DUF6029 family protein [Muribaculaceae bacterium]
MTKRLLLICSLTAASLSAGAITLGDGMALHGSVQLDGLVPQEDQAIGIAKPDDDVLFNSYADLNFISKYVDAGVRMEFMKWPMPGYEPDFAGWGVPHIYAKGRYNGFELTVGDFYDQFGSGFIFRTYQERSLGVDNALRGGRLKVTAIPGLRITALGGVQRRYWDWETSSVVYGGEAEVNFQDCAAALRDKGITWNLSAAYVLKTEDDEDIFLPGTDYRLNVPERVGAWDVRSQFHKGNVSLTGEFAWKDQDPSFDNGYAYNRGTAVLLSGSYSRSGLSAMIQAKRSENMAFRSQRGMSGTSAMINNMPAFNYTHTYALATTYTYATQAAAGEWAFQGAFSYKFKRGSALGGRYGTKVTLNLSYIRGLDYDGEVPNPVMGSNGRSTSFFGMGEAYYHDINLIIDKKWNNTLSQTFMYMNQMYNKTVVEGHGGNIHSNIFVLDSKFKIDKRFTLRNELQYLHTPDDNGDWLYGLLELSVAPYMMVTVSDMWNTGVTDTHYYSFGVTGNYGFNRLQVAYGRTRAGYNCSGGVCRFVPATRGLTVSYSYTF